MDVYWEILQKDVGVKAISVEFQDLSRTPVQKPEPGNLFNTILVTLTNEMIIRMTIGEWQNMGSEIARQIKKKQNTEYGRIGEPENGSS
jgi:hypothetical protein